MKRLLSLCVAALFSLTLLPGVAAAANTCTPPYCPAASVTDTGVTNIKDSSATLNGIVNSNGSDTTYHFELGTTSGTYTITSPNGTIPGTTSGGQAITATVTGLTEKTTYFYRIVATNAGGTTTTTEGTFTTKDNPNVNNPNTTPTTNTPSGTTGSSSGTQTETTQPTISTPSSTPVNDVLAGLLLNATGLTTTQVFQYLTSHGFASLLSSLGFTTSFTAPTAGTFQSDVFALGTPGKAFTSAASHKYALLARGRHTFAAAGTAKIKVKPTSKRRLLKHGSRVQILVRTTFTPKNGKPVVQRKRLTLKRHR